MGTHRCFGNYEPGKNCRACIEQKKCQESQNKKKPGRPPKKKKAEDKQPEKMEESTADNSVKSSEGETSESLL